MKQSIIRLHFYTFIKNNLMQDIHEEVKEYYGTELQNSEDLKTNACCTLTRPPKHILEALNIVAEEVQAKYYGCGLTIPTDVLIVLDTNPLSSLRLLISVLRVDAATACSLDAWSRNVLIDMVYSLHVIAFILSDINEN